MASSTQTIVTPAGRVVRYKRDEVGNDLTAHLAWCETHSEPVWVYGDLSWECPHDVIVQCPSYNHRIAAPPWEKPPP